ncbi:MAG: flagellar assembly protein FliW [Bryobacteraceae bacterium]|nr:flagellar assembly protein FliW [Bryobacteraceae bacterium]
MPRANTRYFGIKEYSEDAVIELAAPMLGFANEKTFVIIQLPEQHPLVYLQSTRTPDLCFVALPVLAVDVAYDLLLSEEDSRLLGVSTKPSIGVEVLCLALIAVDQSGTTANLLAPVVINLRSLRAAQCVNPETSYSHQHLLKTGELVAS